jgi:hypothetical protein
MKDPMIKPLLSALAFALLCVTPSVAQIEEMNGNWLLIPEKSIGPAPAWEMLVFAISDDEQRYTMDAVDAEGRKSHTEWSVSYDGRDHPTTSGAPNTTASIQQTSDRTEFVTNKRDGAITSTYTRVLVDNDRTILSIGRDADGKIQWVRVFEKQ